MNSIARGTAQPSEQETLSDTVRADATAGPCIIAGHQNAAERAKRCFLILDFVMLPVFTKYNRIFSCHDHFSNNTLFVAFIIPFNRDNKLNGEGQKKRAVFWRTFSAQNYDCAPKDTGRYENRNVKKRSTIKVFRKL